MRTQALVLETSVSPFGKKTLLLFTPTMGKILCSLRDSMNCPSPPALIDLEVTEEKKGFFKATELDIEETFQEIRTQEALRKTYCAIVQVIQETIPIKTAAPEIWELLSGILPCLHLFEDSTTALLLLTFSLAMQQGVDLEWIQTSKKLDMGSKEALQKLPTLELEQLLRMKCPESALQALLEEISLGKRRKDAKGGT